MTQDTHMKSRYDAVIVGARVAGASTAMLLARAGLSVLALEKSAYGTDTTSTLALMRAGVMQLHRWGVLDRIVTAGTPAIRQTIFHYGEESVEVEIKERDGVGALYAPRRTVLDTALVDAAREAGAEVVHGARVERVLRDGSGRAVGVLVTDSAGELHEVTAGIVIGADGAHSMVARAMKADVLATGSHPAAFVYGLWRGLDIEATHWYYGSSVAAGAIPTNDDMVCVFAGMPLARYSNRTQDLDELYAQVLRETNPDLADGVAHAERVGKLHPFPGHNGFVRRSWGPGWALVGDAASFKDPLTAHGITDALRDAELLANAVIAGGDAALARYEAAQHHFTSEFVQLSDEIASFDWDMDRIKPLHHRLSRLMNREYDFVRSLASSDSPRWTDAGDPIDEHQLTRVLERGQREARAVGRNPERLRYKVG